MLNKYKASHNALASCQNLAVKLYILSSFVNQIGASPTILLQPSGVDQNIVGKRQDVICSISVHPNVNPDTVELGWLNEDDFITNDSRVTIIESMHDSSNNSTNLNASVITSILRFNPLFEDDEGIYYCYSKVNETEMLTSIQQENFQSK